MESAGRKLLALFGRTEARDFADVYVLAQRFGNDALLEQAEVLDAGFDLQVLAQMMGTLGRFASDEIPLAASDVPLAKTFFSAWAEELRGGFDTRRALPWGEFSLWRRPFTDWCTVFCTKEVGW